VREDTVTPYLLRERAVRGVVGAWHNVHRHCGGELKEEGGWEDGNAREVKWIKRWEEEGGRDGGSGL